MIIVVVDDDDNSTRIDENTIDVKKRENERIMRNSAFSILVVFYLVYHKLFEPHTEKWTQY